MEASFTLRSLDLKYTFLLLLFLLLALAPAGAAEPAVDDGAEQVTAARLALEQGDPELARSAARRALSLAEAGDDPLRLAAGIVLAAAEAELGSMDRAMAAFAEAIGAADRLALVPSNPQALGVLVRVQLAEMLRAHDRHVDAEAAAWNALDVAVSIGDLDAAGSGLRLIVLSALDQGAEPEDLAGLVVELDLALSPLDAYRLHVPPPPEPVVTLLEGLALQLAQAGELELALESFAAVAEVDMARSATWRLDADLSQLAWAALQVGDLRRARWALDRADAVQGEVPSIDLPANRCALLVEEGSLAAAVEPCRAALRQAEGEGSSFQAAALAGRLALLEAGSGSWAEAGRLHHRAAERFDAAGLPGDALLERVRAAGVLAAQGRFEEALTESARALAPLEGGEPPRPVREVLVDIDRLRILAGAVERPDAEQLAGEVERWLFEQERAEALVAMASIHVTWALEDGDDEALGRASEALVALEEAVGLGQEGWHGPWAAGLAQGAPLSESGLQLWQEGIDRSEWRAAQLEPVPDVPRSGPGEPSTAAWSPLTLHRAALAGLLEQGEAAAALDLADRSRSVRWLAAWAGGQPEPQGAVEEQLLQVREEAMFLRRRMQQVSFRGGERSPQELRAELGTRLEALRAEESALLEALPAGRRFVLSVPPSPAPPRSGVVLLSLVELDSGLAVFVGSEAGVRGHRIEDELSSLADDFLETATRPPRKRWKPRDDRPSLGRLADVLVTPFAQELAGAERVVWIPSPGLESLPLAALQLPDGRLIGDVAEVVTLPSWRLGASLQESAPSLLPAPRVVSSEDLEQGLELEPGSTVWFDTPCLAGERKAPAAGLRLRPSDEQGRATQRPPADGRLQPDEVLAAGWRPGLVVLPACEPGPGEALQVWATAFGAAGAGAVLQAMWEPAPQAAELFRTALVEQLAAGESPSAALAAAQARVRRRWADPRAWAGWRLATAP